MEKEAVNVTGKMFALEMDDIAAMCRGNSDITCVRKADPLYVSSDSSSMPPEWWTVLFHGSGEIRPCLESASCDWIGETQDRTPCPRHST